LKTYISDKANKKLIYDGDATKGFGWAGQVTGLIQDVPSVEELIQRMVVQAEKIRLKWGQ